MVMFFVAARLPAKFIRLFAVRLPCPRAMASWEGNDFKGGEYLAGGASTAASRHSGGATLQMASAAETRHTMRDPAPPRCAAVQISTRSTSASKAPCLPPPAAAAPQPCAVRRSGGRTHGPAITA
ncbi:unnamed protein product [Urochloa humidicola]